MNNPLSRAAHRAAYLALKAVGLRGNEVVIFVEDRLYTDRGWLLSALGPNNQHVLNEVDVQADDTEGWDRILANAGLRRIPGRGDWVRTEHDWIAMCLPVTK